jgi:hypothetical protein
LKKVRHVIAEQVRHNVGLLLEPRVEAVAVPFLNGDFSALAEGDLGFFPFDALR